MTVTIPAFVADMLYHDRKPHGGWELHGFEERHRGRWVEYIWMVVYREADRLHQLDNLYALELEVGLTENNDCSFPWAGLGEDDPIELFPVSGHAITTFTYRTKEDT